MGYDLMRLLGIDLDGTETERCIETEYFQDIFCCSKKLSIFVPALVRKCRSTNSTKRESGENLEQTRYCKS